MVKAENAKEPHQQFATGATTTTTAYSR